MAGGYGNYLERQARKLVSRNHRSRWEPTPTAVIEREISLILDHLDRIRQLYQIQKKQMIRLECRIGTQIKQLYPKTPYSIDTRWKDRERLQGKILKIEQERRKLKLIQQEQIRQLYDQLLKAMNRYRQLEP